MQVLATDRDGESTLSAPSTLLIDGVPPTVQDRAAPTGDRGERAGAATATRASTRSAVSVSFGDGASAHGRTRFAHRYATPGVYRVIVHVRDKLGNERRRAASG